jgi:hypothetical protein
MNYGENTLLIGGRLMKRVTEQWKIEWTPNKNSAHYVKQTLMTY